MSDAFTALLTRFGAKAVLVSLVVSLSIWGLAHVSAAPGQEVTVLWGLASYTKKVEPRSSATVPEGTKKENNSSAVADVVPSQSRATSAAASDSYVPPVEPGDRILPPEDVEEVTGVTKQNVAKITGELRMRRNARELTATESNRRVQELPTGTYFFLDIDGFHYHEAWDIPVVLRAHRAKRFPSRLNYVEAQLFGADELHLVVFVDEGTAVRIAKLDGVREHEVLAFTRPGSNRNILVSLSAERIIQAYPRDIQTTESHSDSALDLVIR